MTAMHGDSVIATASPPARARTLLDGLDGAARAVVVVALLSELGIVIFESFGRSLFNISFLWVDEAARLALATLTFVGGAVAYRRHEHTSVRTLINRLPVRVRPGVLALSDCLVLLGCLVAGAAAWTLVRDSWSERTSILSLPVGTMAIPLLVSMSLIILFGLERLWLLHGRAAILPAVGLCVLMAVLLLTFDTWSDWLDDNHPIYITLVLFFSVVLTGLPVGFALLLSSAAYLWISGGAPMVALAQNMVNGTGNFVLLAIPFFVVAGLVMERGGLSIRLVHFVHAMVGHFRGGLLQVMVISMYLVSGLSGSKAADVAAVGSVMRDMLQREKIDAARATAVLAASAAMGETIPPSLAMLILGSITSLSVASMFIGGLIPAAVIAACLMAMIYLDARRSGMAPQKRAPWRVIGRAGLHALLPMAMPIALFAGILLGFATPTEVSAFAVVYGLFLAIFVYREMNWRDFIVTVIDGAAMTGMILFILAAASSFSWALTIANLPTQLVSLLQSMNGSYVIFMLASIVLLIVVGSLLEGLPALNVMAPLLMPLAIQFGISQLHYGMVLIIAMGIGAFMPPAGVGFYVCCAIMRVDIEHASRAMLPYFAVLLVGLLIVTFFPWLSLVLPRLFHFVV